MEGCLSQLSVYPACLLAGLYQASLVLLMIFQLLLKLVTVMGSCLLIKTCSGRCFPVLTKPPVLSRASSHFWAPEGGSISVQKAASCTVLRQLRKQGEMEFASCSGATHKSLKIILDLKAWLQELAKQVLPICFLKSHFSRLMLPQSLFQGFPRYRNLCWTGDCLFPKQGQDRNFALALIFFCLQ